MKDRNIYHDPEDDPCSDYETRRMDYADRRHDEDRDKAYEEAAAEARDAQATNPPTNPTFANPTLTRQQRRHLKQIVEYHVAIAKQGTVYIRGFHKNPKGPPHVGAKQLAKIAKRQNQQPEP